MRTEQDEVTREQPASAPAGNNQSEVTLEMLTSGFTDSEKKTIEQAYELARQLYAEQKTIADILKFVHGVSTANTVRDLGLDCDAVAAAILNHVSEEDELNQIEQTCGREVATLVRGLRRLDIYTGESEGKRADTLESIRRAVLSVVAGDVRVVVIRLAMALQTLLAAEQLPAERKERIAKDVQAIYAPLANRLGIWQLKWELEDTAFKYLEPEAYNKIRQALDEQRSAREERIRAARKKLQQALAQDGINAEVTGRPKHIYSIHRKMKRKGISAAQVFDANALRIIIPGDEPSADELRERRAKQHNQNKRDKLPVFERSEDQKKADRERQQTAVEHCYRALGIVHGLWKPILEELDDYIQYPKSNGYRSLHTAVVLEPETDDKKTDAQAEQQDDNIESSDGASTLNGNGNAAADVHGKINNDILEIQIRSKRMHIEAEQGFAAHWAYKEGGRANSAMARQIKSLRRVLMQSGDFGQAIEQFNPDVNEEEQAENKAPRERVFVFTPNGDLIDLPQGATPVDFAYAIHTDVGHRCRGAKINGKMRTLTYQLQSGDTVEILTAGKKEEGRPSRDWLNTAAGYVVTTKARNRIRSWFRQHERARNIEYGRTYLERELRQYKGADIGHDDLALHFGEVDVEDFLAKVGFGDYSANQIRGAAALILRDREVELAEQSDADTPEQPLRPAQQKHADSLTVYGEAGLMTRIARCCNPIPPEPIIGYITRGRGVTVHRADCREIVHMLDEEPERVVRDVTWGKDNGRYQVPFRIKAYRTSNLIEKIASVLQGQNVNLIKSKATASGRHMQIYLLAEVRDVAQADWVAKKLGTMEPIYEVISR